MHAQGEREKDNKERKSGAGPTAREMHDGRRDLRLSTIRIDMNRTNKAAPAAHHTW